MDRKELGEDGEEPSQMCCSTVLVFRDPLKGVGSLSVSFTRLILLSRPGPMSHLHVPPKGTDIAQAVWSLEADVLYIAL